MRLFVALEPEEKIRNGIMEAMKELSARHKNIRWVSPENLHFTMKFLGEVNDSRLGEVVAAVESSVIGIKPFRLHVCGLGYFGSRESAKVVWAGAHEGGDELVQLAKRLDSNLSVFRQDSREPSPHLTICRPKGRTLELIQGIEKMKSRDFGVMNVESIALKSSMLAPDGAMHETIREIRLQA